MTPEDLPAGPLLVDTDVFSFVTTGKGAHRAFSPFLTGRLLALSFATVGELRAGMLKANWGPPRVQEMERRVRECVVLTSTEAVTRQYAALHAHPQVGGQLRGGGQNDMWIAACALAQPDRPRLVTNNRRDFQLIARHFPLLLVHPDMNQDDPGWS